MNKATPSDLAAVKDRLDARREDILVGESEAIYREIFERSPISIWVEDWSAAKTCTDDLKRRGVTDIRAYFIENPARLKELADLVEVHDVNWTTVALYGAPSKEALIDRTWGETMTIYELGAFRDQLAAFASGKTTITTEDQESRFDGSPMWIRNRAVIHPDHLDDWSLVIFAASDIGEAMNMGKALGGDLERLSDILSNVPCVLYRRICNADGVVTYPYINGLRRLLPGFGPDMDDADLMSEAVVSGAANHPDDGGRWCAAWRDSADHLSAVDLEYRIVDPSGRAVWVRNTATPKRGDAGDIVWDGVMSAVADGQGG